MMNIKLMNKIAAVGTDLLDRKKYNVGEDVAAPDAIMVRSAVLHDMEFNPELMAISRCGAGVNNIPIDRCSEAGIVVFNTPGANANGVKELAIAALIMAARDIAGGLAYANSLVGTENVAKTVEKGKSAFVGNELYGKTLGVIGLGAIGGMVATTATHLGMNVIGCDPYLTVEGAWSLSREVKKAATFEEIFAEADYITLHVPATPETKNMIYKETLATMKDGVRIVNLSRADLVNINDMKEALESGKVARYVTDFPTEASVGVPGIVNIPHLGASTEESEENCAVMAAKELDEFLATGNIAHSVNFPAVSLPHSGDIRVCLLHANVPAVISKISGSISAEGINIENLINKSKGNNAYTILEIKGELTEYTVGRLETIDGMYRVRVIK